MMSVKYSLIIVLVVAALLAAVSQQLFFSERGYDSVVASEITPQQKTSPVPDNKAATTTEFARLIETLSEPGAYFDTDNLISNETSYLHVMGKLRQMKVQGGAYIGVGPDQNFSYIAQIRPRIALMLDIRRDNLLQHLFFKALFEQSNNRIEYLCLLTGKPFPPNQKEWNTRTVQQLVEYTDKAAAKRELFEANSQAVRKRVSGYGITLKPEELDTITRIHTAFFSNGLDLRFTSHGRSPRAYYPTLRDLILEKDLTGKQANYLASEDDFQFLKSLQEQNKIIPVVGDLAGKHALAAIAKFLTERNEKVSAFYTSNVEYYLMRDDSFDRYAANVKKLPMDARSVIIRSFFGGGWGYALPQSVPGYYSTQLLQPLESFVKEYDKGGIQSYSDLISKHSLELK